MQSCPGPTLWRRADVRGAYLHATAILPPCCTKQCRRHAVPRSDRRERGRRRTGHEGSVLPLRAGPTPCVVHGAFFASSHRRLGGRRYQCCVRGCCLAAAPGAAVSRGAADAHKAAAVVVRRATMATTLPHRHLSYRPVQGCRAVAPGGRHLRHSAELSHDEPPTPSCHQNDALAAVVTLQLLGPLRSPQHRVIARNGRMLSSRQAVARMASPPPHRHTAACETAARVAPLHRHAQDRSRIVVPLRGGPQNRC